MPSWPSSSSTASNSRAPCSLLNRIRLPMESSGKGTGKKYPPFEYEVGREKIREYANAVGEADRVHHDPEAARAAGFRNVVAPPMFCVVYSAGAMGPAILDPALGINLMLMVHGGQEFEWGEPVVAGDTITTGVTVKDVYEKNG